MNASRRDRTAVLRLLCAGFAAGWVYVFMHPSPEVFTINISALGAFGAIFHWLCVRDDKIPDRKDQPSGP